MTRYPKLIITMICILVPLLLVLPAAAGDATQISIHAGNSQSAVAGAAVATPPSVLVVDNTSSPVSGATVTFAVASGGGTITGASATTDSSGIATVGSWTLGTTAGTNTLTATCGSLTAVTFTATGTAGTATQLIKNAGDSQSATVSTAVSTPPSVIVKDANGNPVSGASVSFTVTSGGGSVSGGSTTTGSNGVATVTSWTLGSTAGTNVLTVTSGSLTPVSFTATGTAATSAPTISSITPSYGYNNSAVSITSLAGTGFVSGASIVLSKSGKTNISTSSSSFSSSTLMTCTFDITNKEAGTWNVILTNPDGQAATLTNGFEIRVPGNGTISLTSNPSGATVYLGAIKKGVTPLTLSDILPGTYGIRMQQTGYSDYTTQVIVTAGNTSTVSASLTQAETYTTTATTIPPLTTVSTVRTTKKTTTKVPTPWPTATTQSSPIAPLVVIGAVGLGILILRRD